MGQFGDEVDRLGPVLVEVAVAIGESEGSMAATASKSGLLDLENQFDRREPRIVGRSRRSKIRSMP